MRIVITGAAGNIGTAAVEELSRSHDLRLIDIRQVEGAGSLVADLSIAPFDTALGGGDRWSSTFENTQVVIHLAANAQSVAPWEKVLPDNIQATWNVLETAANHGVPA